MSSLISSSRRAENSPSDNELWKIYGQSPKVREVPLEKNVKEKITGILRRLINHFKEDLSEGVLFYCEGWKAHVVYLNTGGTEEEEIETDFYTSSLQSKIYNVLKTCPQLGEKGKNLKHYQISLCPGDEKVDFEILKFSNTSPKSLLLADASFDFDLKVKEKVIQINGQALMQKGGEIMSAFIKYTLSNDLRSLCLDDYSFKVVENYQKFVSLDDCQFLEDSTVQEVCDLYKFAQKFACDPLRKQCAKYLGFKSAKEHLVLLQDLFCEYKDGDIGTICDKFQSADLLFELDMS